MSVSGFVWVSDNVAFVSFGNQLLLWCYWQELLAPVLARPDLLVTRNVEWANLAFGFEQVPIASREYLHIFASASTTAGLLYLV